MATKSDKLFVWEKVITDNGENQFLNLNLNQNNHRSALTPFQSYSKSNFNKDCATAKTVKFDNKHERGSSSQSWKKTINDKCLKTWNDLHSYDEAKVGIKKQWNNGSIDTTNNSTLSLHIAAYENSNESLIGREESPSERIKATKMLNSELKLKDPFEYPRQMKDNNGSRKPEVMQFKASQKLFNPNETMPSCFKNEWDSAAPIDILPLLPQNFQELINRKKWQERKEALDELLELATTNIKLDPNVNYDQIVESLSKILEKDGNILVRATAARCTTQLALGLRRKFRSHPTLTQNIIENLKEKNPKLLIPIIETMDVIYSLTSLEVMCDDLAIALKKSSPNVKFQINQFLYRVFKTLNAHTAPKMAIQILTPLIVKCMSEPNMDIRQASSAAMGALMEVIGKANTMPMLGDIATTKMERLLTFYNQDAEKAKQEEAKKAFAKDARDVRIMLKKFNDLLNGYDEIPQGIFMKEALDSLKLAAKNISFIGHNSALKMPAPSEDIQSKKNVASLEQILAQLQTNSPKDKIEVFRLLDKNPEQQAEYDRFLNFMNNLPSF